MWLTLLVTLFVLVLMVNAGLTLFGMPGNWISVAAALLYEWLVPAESDLRLGWGFLAAILVLAAVGEVLEFVAGAMGVTRQGGSRRSAVLAVVGSLAGGIAGAILGLPVPVIGSVVAVVLFSGIGALAGAFWGEYMWMGRDADASVRVGIAAFWARLLGTFAKSLMSGGILIAAVVGMIV